MRERLSALADGELVPGECPQTLAWAQTAQGQSSWQAWHTIGDVMRGVPATPMLDNALLERLRGQIAREMRPAGSAMASQAVSVVGRPDAVAANASLWHWKLAAGFASLTAAVALGWTAYASMGSQGSSGMQLALAGGAPGVAVAAAQPATKLVMDEKNIIRDPRLDELVRQTGRYGGMSVMMREPLLRNASLETATRR